MRALILNSGLGSRMGDITKTQPKCMTSIHNDECILGRQLTQLHKIGVNKIVMTTGFSEGLVKGYCRNYPNLEFIFVNNPEYRTTNYIYSIYLARDFLRDDIILMHGDLVFEESVLRTLSTFESSYMVVSSEEQLTGKDFKAVLNKDNTGRPRIEKVGVAYLKNAVAAQPLYLLYKKEWDRWLDRITFYCEEGKTSCYAEDALNEITRECEIYPFDIHNAVCGEIDTIEDLYNMRRKLGHENENSLHML